MFLAASEFCEIRMCIELLPPLLLPKKKKAEELKNDQGVN